MSYSGWRTDSLLSYLAELRDELARLQPTLERARIEYNRKWEKLYNAAARARYWTRRASYAERGLKRSKTIASIARSSEKLARRQLALERNQQEVDDLVRDARSIRSIQILPLESRIRTVVRYIDELEDELQARIRTVTVESEPIDVFFTYDGREESTPFSFSVYRGSVVTVNMPEDAADQGIDYLFQHWEDGSTNPKRSIRVFDNVTLVATYEVPPPAYGLFEYVKYYKYLTSAKYKRRHFEARGIFSVRSDVDPASLLDKLEVLFDKVMEDLGIQIDETWDIGWKVGGEPTGETVSKFITHVVAEVVDIERGGKVYVYPKFPTLIVVSEVDFFGPR